MRTQPLLRLVARSGVTLWIAGLCGVLAGRTIVSHTTGTAVVANRIAFIITACSTLQHRVRQQPGGVLFEKSCCVVREQYSCTTTPPVVPGCMLENNNTEALQQVLAGCVRLCACLMVYVLHNACMLLTS